MTMFRRLLYLLRPTVLRGRIRFWRRRLANLIDPDPGLPPIVCVTGERFILQGMEGREVCVEGGSVVIDGPQTCLQTLSVGDGNVSFTDTTEGFQVTNLTLTPDCRHRLNELPATGPWGVMTQEAVSRLAVGAPCLVNSDGTVFVAYHRGGGLLVRCIRGEIEALPVATGLVWMATLQPTWQPEVLQCAFSPEQAERSIDGLWETSRAVSDMMHEYRKAWK